MDAALLAALRVIPDTFGFPRGGYPPASDLLCCEFYHTGVLFLRYVGVRVMKTGTVSSGTITCFPTRWRCFGETSNLVLSIDEKRMFIRQRYSPDLCANSEDVDDYFIAFYFVFISLPSFARRNFMRVCQELAKPRHIL